MRDETNLIFAACPAARFVFCGGHECLLLFGREEQGEKEKAIIKKERLKGRFSFIGYPLSPLENALRGLRGRAHCPLGMRR